MSEWLGYGTPTAPEVSAVFRDAARCFADLGATVEPVDPFFDYDPYDRLAPMVFAGLTGMAAGITGGRIDSLLPELQAVIAEGREHHVAGVFRRQDGRNPDSVARRQRR